MEIPLATHTLAPLSKEKTSDGDAYTIIMFCIIAFILALCATLLFPELGTTLAQFTLS